MEFSKKRISMEKTMSSLDRFVFDFCNILEKEGIRYVVVSGYVAIVFGRSRNTEDIDILIEKINFKKFEKLWNELKKKYDCINTDDMKTAYYDYLNTKTAIRFSRKCEIIPNIEFKFVKTQEDKFSLDNAVELNVNKRKILISPLELQIAYKLKLGSDKDIDDAIFLYELFRKELNNEKLKKWTAYFKVPKEIINELNEN